MKKTIPQQLINTCKKYSDKTALYHKQSGEWQDISFQKLLHKVTTIAQAIHKENLKKKSTIAILSENRWEWLVTDLGIMMSGNITVPLHSTNAVKVNNYILKHCAAKMLFISEKELNELKDNSLFEGTKIDQVIVYGDNEIENCKLKIKNFNEFMMNKNSEIDAKNITPKSQDPANPACILYTSGTTGNPKGVPLTHQNLLSNIEQVLEVIDVYDSDTFLSFLPYSHALEHTAGFLLPLCCGSTIALAESIEKLGGNLKEIHPTIMITVPRIFERFYDKVMDKIRASSSIKQKLFHWALTTNPKSKGIKRKLAEVLVFKNIQNNVGGKIRLFVSGGSSLTKEIAEFFSTTGLKVIEGYGLTETSPIIACNRVENVKFGTVGQPMPKTEIKVTEEGELLVKGPQVMSGYKN
jgi:long-chain acyl-CoA synthetase